jgi:hypothetical protein
VPALVRVVMSIMHISIYPYTYMGRIIFFFKYMGHIIKSLKVVINLESIFSCI